MFVLYNGCLELFSNHLCFKGIALLIILCIVLCITYRCYRSANMIKFWVEIIVNMSLLRQPITESPTFTIYSTEMANAFFLLVLPNEKLKKNVALFPKLKLKKQNRRICHFQNVHFALMNSQLEVEIK
jgi:hypothetical protein